MNSHQRRIVRRKSKRMRAALAKSLSQLAPAMKSSAISFGEMRRWLMQSKDRDQLIFGDSFMIDEKPINPRRVTVTLKNGKAIGIEIPDNPFGFTEAEIKETEAFVNLRERLEKL